MIRPIFRLFFILAIAGIITSCSKFVAGEEQEEEVKTANSLLTIKAKAVAEDGSTTPDGEEVKISYPVNIYVFDANGKCVKVSNIADEGATVDMKLPAGQYDVYALAGATADNYEVPTQTNVSPGSLIALKEGKNQGDIMTTHNSVTLSEGVENKLTLNLERKVVLLQKIVMNSIPADAENVSVTISPVYTDLKLDGTYAETTAPQTIQLTKNVDNGTWSNATEMYILPSKGKPTITVNIQRPAGTKSFSYGADQDFPANYKVNINGTYFSGDVSVSGTINGAKYQGVKNIKFDMKDTGEPSTNPEEPKADITVEGSVPAVGTEYKGCYVLNVVGSTATLIAPKDFSKLGFDINNYDAAKKAVEEKLAALKVNGLSGWRLPTFEEIEYVYQNMIQINSDLLSIVNKTKVAIDNFGSNYYYFFNDNGTLKQYYTGEAGGTVSNKFNSGPSGLLRGFLTVKFK